MTIKQLIRELSVFPSDAEVVIYDDTTQNGEDIYRPAYVTDYTVGELRGAQKKVCVLGPDLLLDQLELPVTKK